MADEMQGLAQGAGAMAEQVKGLRAAVDSGQVVMDPEAAENLAKFYEGKADDIRDEAREAYQLVVREGFGDCKIGAAIGKKFGDKAEFEVIPMLRTVENNLRDLANAVRASSRETQANDDEQARQLGRNL